MAVRYLETLSDLPLRLPADAPTGDTHSWHLFVIRLTDTARCTRDEVIQRLSDRGIGTSVHYVPLHRHPYWRDRYGLRSEMFPAADAAYLSMVSIPLYTAMSDADQVRVIDALREVLCLMAKRMFDIAFSALALTALAPLLLAIALWVTLDSPGPAFFRQVRVGRRGREFRIFKFRTMHVDAERTGLHITVGTDARVTRSGAFLRKYKLDELPQFINVLYGDMSIVGPRPEVPRIVALYPADLRELVLSVRPGITDRASIEFRNENVLLGASVNPEAAYVEQVMPIKLGYYAEYAADRSFAGDLMLIWRTAVLLLPSGQHQTALIVLIRVGRRKCTEC